MFLSTIFIAFAVIASAQPPVATEPPSAPVIEEVLPEVVVNGKPISQLSDEEKQKFLQKKVKRVKQADLEVRLVRIAPGYPVTFAFPEPVKNFSVGDAKLIVAQNVSSKEMLLTALSRPPGDTTFQVVVKNGKRFIYHIFLAENLADADLVICVNKPSAWICGLKWMIGIGILAIVGYIFRERIKNFKLVQKIIHKIKTN